MDRYSIGLENGRSLTLAADQVRRIARGLGGADELVSGQEPPIVAAIRALPAVERAEAWAVLQLRFGEKLDLESIAHTTGLTPWRVWQLEERFRRALDEVQSAAPARRTTVRPGFALGS